VICIGQSSYEGEWHSAGVLVISHAILDSPSDAVVGPARRNRAAAWR
jgi:hypothetical protein